MKTGSKIFMALRSFIFSLFFGLLLATAQPQALQLGSGTPSAFETAPVLTNAVALPVDPMSGVPTATSPQGGTMDTSDLLRVGDTVIIRLTGVPASDQGIFEVKVDESGKISMPHIGSLQAANTTTVQLKKIIESTYIKEEIFTNPNVTVDLKEQRFVDVTGEVRSPMRVPYTKDLTAMGAVAACGGFTDFANRRRVKLTQAGTTREFNAKEIQADQGRDIRLTPNDKIQVDRSIF